MSVALVVSIRFERGLLSHDRDSRRFEPDRRVSIRFERGLLSHRLSLLPVRWEEITFQSALSAAFFLTVVAQPKLTSNRRVSIRFERGLLSHNVLNGSRECVFYGFNPL